MRIIDCGGQRTEKWDQVRAGLPTASEFSSFCTPARGDYSKQAGAYAAKIVAKRLGVYVEDPPSFWMTWGTEQEPNAKAAYELQTGRRIQDVDFVTNDSGAYGCSPDGLVGDDGGYEAKCPKPETLLLWHRAGVLPIKHKPQVQGSLLITGRKWWDFYGFHPELTPFLLRVFPDEEYQTKIAKNLLKLLHEIDLIEAKVQRMRHPLVSLGTQQDKVRFSDE